MSRRQLRAGDRLVLASLNRGKVAEFAELFASYHIDTIPAGDIGLAEPEETAETFAGNARIKALAAATAAGLPALADDSGLAVASLDGRPGIHSARWAGPNKDFDGAMRRIHDAVVAKTGWPEGGSAASFICVLSLAWPDGSSQEYTGETHGRLIWPPRGSKGFGYDPMFRPDGACQTFAEMSSTAKQAISHRARAFAAFRNDVLEQPAIDRNRNDPD